MNHIIRIFVTLNGRIAELRTRAEVESERGDIVEKVIIVAGVALITIAAVAAIKALVDGKIANINL